MSVLACDVGGTRIKLGIVDHGQLLASRIVPAESDRGLAQALTLIEGVLKKLCREAGISISGCRGIGMGFPALVNRREGRILNKYGRYLDAPQLDLNAWASERFGLPLAIDNDARLALLGESTCGAGRGSDNLAIVTLGTGIGTAVISGGRLLRGPHFRAGNLCGHLIVNPNGRLCHCGARGCIEVETGSLYLDEHLRRMPGFDKSAISQHSKIDYAVVCQCTAEGDEFATAVLQRATTLWGVLCVNMIHSFDLDRIVIGGGLMASADAILPLICEFVSNSVNCPWGQPQIVAAEHPDHMALLGSESLLHETLGL